MCNVYTDVGGIKYIYRVCPPVRKIIHSLKLVDYLHVQADNPWYNYYLYHPTLFMKDSINAYHSNKSFKSSLLFLSNKNVILNFALFSSNSITDKNKC